MKTLQYFTSGTHLDQLTERFGSQLELLDRPQKLQLRAILTYFVLGREMMSDEYSIGDAVSDFNLWQLFIPDQQLQDALETLEGVTVEDAESLLEALQAQCRHGNAKLRTSTDSMADELIRQGIPHELAEEAAYILTVVDAQGQRTQHQQWLISQVHKIILGRK
ncbi:hypothetical protein F7734_56215 [Scytonema sp. UIC 10036]|uniref:hypothetical protein n=1 Tax=Scytonema sp. UIC 10036 TaxID=2304196 RepID=UPI0012DA7442|nr:hypothetical protein [Scytonema sp. UIC 10036]MUH01123.1 hypothetical protein [Scytonema sp. UIC 10036]